MYLIPMYKKVGSSSRYSIRKLGIIIKLSKNHLKIPNLVMLFEGVHYWTHSGKQKTGESF